MQCLSCDLFLAYLIFKGTSGVVLPGSSVAIMEVITYQARRFQLTLNKVEHYDEVKDYITSRKPFKYLLSCKEEAPTTGHEHIHIFVCFSQAIRLSQTKIKGAHLEICRGSNKQNIDYIRKNGNIIDELGEPPSQGVSSNDTVGDLMSTEDPLSLPARLFSTWRDVSQWNQSLMRMKIYKPGIKVFYIWGESGVGKTRYVFDHLKEDEPFDRVIHANGFWSGVSYDQSVRTAWYDDFRSSDMKPSEFIKFIDYYANVMNVKGGHVLNHYDTIYITSILDPKHIYEQSYAEEQRKQWLRRMEIIHIE